MPAHGNPCAPVATARPMFHRRPAALGQLPAPAAVSIARLAALEGFARALLVGIVPLAALHALGTKELVAQAYLAASVLTLCVTLNLGTLERLLRRRGVVSLGAGFLVLASMLLHSGHPVSLSLGIGMRSAAASMFSVCISLYVMDYIAKREYVRSESIRIRYVALSWLVAPSLGPWLLLHATPASPYAVSAMAALAMLALFWRLRLGEDAVIVPARSVQANPLRSIVRFWSQKRLRIAYAITLSRSCFWVSLFVYGPIYVVEAGLPAWMAGGLLSGVSALLFLSPLVLRLSERYGTRQVLVVNQLVMAASLAGLALVGEARPIGLVFWATGSLGGVALDVLGNVPFMRSVRPRERTAMTTVFSTWREASELVTPLIITLVLLVFPFHALYAVLAAMLVGVAVATSRLPKRL